MSDTPIKKPIRRGVVGNKPKIVIPIQALAAIAETTNYQVVIHRYKAKIRNPKTAIRAKCVECSGGSLKEVQDCRVKDCALYPFRMGENPFHGTRLKNQALKAGQQTPDEDFDEEDE